MLLTRAQAADLAGLSEQTLRSWSWRHKAKLPLHDAARRYCELERKVGRVVRIDSDDLNEWLAARQRPASTSSSGEHGTVADDVDDRPVAEFVVVTGYCNSIRLRVVGQGEASDRSGSLGER